jgi:hypothetical protein
VLIIDFEEYLEKLSGWTDVDVIISAPDSMSELVARKNFGQKLMPNLKANITRCCNAVKK